MKNLLIISLFTFILFSCSNSNEKTSILSVNGHCEMCKGTIENSLKTEGIYQAEWNVETKELNITYDSTLINFDSISNKISKVGYETTSASSEKSDTECCEM